MQRTLTIQHRRTLLREALEIMDAEYAHPLELDDVARRVATSRRQLQRCFTEHSHASFRARLAEIRMQRAAELLVTTSLPVRTVASAVGYRQPAQFAKAFRRSHGTAPAEYRAARRGLGEGGRPPRLPARADARPPRDDDTPSSISDFFAIAV
jgi:AraC family transcriptional regulator, regulatory protein of adaptative response / methylphosphotriester-DNA alkyltransferase methyltransferase